jgi:hypothetical protein
VTAPDRVLYSFNADGRLAQIDLPERLDRPGVTYGYDTTPGPNLGRFK